MAKLQTQPTDCLPKSAVVVVAAEASKLPHLGRGGETYFPYLSPPRCSQLSRKGLLHNETAMEVDPFSEKNFPLHPFLWISSHHFCGNKVYAPSCRC